MLLFTFETASVYHIGDADGDGRPDLYVAGYSNIQVCQLGLKAPYQFGPTYGGAVDMACSQWPTTWPSTPITTYWGDFNGDGRIDRAFYMEATASWNVQLAGNGGFADLLVGVVNGLGHETQFSYKGINDPSVYTRGADTVYPKRNVLDVAPLVSQQRTSNALGGWLTTDYTYQGRRADLRGRGDLGFEKVTSVDRTTNITTDTSLSQDFPFTGIPVRDKATQANGVILKDASFTPSSFTTAGGALFPYISASTQTTRDLNNASIATTSKQVNAGGIDAYGNITSSTETVVADGDTFTTTTTNSYDNLTTDWLIGLLRRTSVTKTALQPSAVPATPGSLSLSGCSSSSPAAWSTAATMTCTLGNSGESVVSSISYSAPGNTSARGPSNCAAKTANCGTVTVTTGTATGNYTGTLTATPSPAGSAATASVSLVVNPPAVVFQPALTNWGTIGVASDSGDWPTIKNNSAVSVLITGHSPASGPAGMWSWQGSSGYCIPGTTVLAAGASCVTFFGTGSLATPGAYSATDRISFQVVGGNGTTYTTQQNYAFGMAATSASPGSLSFGNIAMNTRSSTQSVTIVNNALNSPVNIALALVGNQPANFAMSHTCGTNLAAGASCTVTVSFAPTSIANGVSAAVQISTTFPRMRGGSPEAYYFPAPVYTVALSGNGTGSIATLTSPAAQTVPATWYGATASSVTASYRNDGNVPLTLATPALTAPLSVTSNSCSNVAAGSSCSIVVRVATNVPGMNQSQSFTPGSATVAPAATAVTWTTYTAVPRWGSTALNFGNVPIGSAASQNIALYNDGNVTYNWAVNNTVANKPAGYSFDTSACASVAPAASCNVVATLAPTAATSYAGSGLTMSTASYSTNSFSVSGTGYYAPQIAASPAQLSATSTAPAAAVTGVGFSNNSPTATTLTLSITGGFTLSAYTLNCLAPGSCGGVNVTSPTAAGTYSGTLSVVSSAGGTVPTVPVTFTVYPTPTNTTVTANPGSINFGTVSQGMVSPDVSVTVANTGQAPAALNISLTSPATNFHRNGGSCVPGAQLAAGASCTTLWQFDAGCTAGLKTNTLVIQGGNYPALNIPLSGTTSSVKSGACN